jgi:uncharacterized protein YukE
MAEGFTVSVAEVRTHANTVSSISGQVNSACGMAQASVHDDAYGMIGRFFAAALMGASDLVRDGIIKAAKSFTDVHNGLRQVADLYEQVDRAHAELLGLNRGDNRR